VFAAPDRPRHVVEEDVVLAREPFDAQVEDHLGHALIVA